MGKRFIGAVLAALMALSAASTALADDDLDDQLEDLRQRAAAQQEVTNEAAARVDSISEQMRLIQLEVEEASDAYKAVKSELDDIQAKIEENEELLDTTEKTMKGKVKKLVDPEYVGKTVKMGIRPENLHDEELFLNNAPDTIIDADVEVVELMGSETYLYLKTVDTGIPFIARVDARSTSRAGDRIKIGIDANRLHFFDVDTEATILNR